MTVTQIIIGQISDPFRIILLAGLIYTMLRTRAATGTWLPLAAGILFVAALIPSTTATQGQSEFFVQFGTGIFTNLILTAILLGLYEAYQKLRSK